MSIKARRKMCKGSVGQSISPGGKSIRVRREEYTGQEG